MPHQPTILASDLEGVLVPEIWIAVAEKTGIPELRRTTRDEPDYDNALKRSEISFDESSHLLKKLLNVCAYSRRSVFHARSIRSSSRQRLTKRSLFFLSLPRSLLESIKKIIAIDCRNRNISILASRRSLRLDFTFLCWSLHCAIDFSAGGAFCNRFSISICIVSGNGHFGKSANSSSVFNVR